jgi:thiol-disulfide isomerase/thioredoxin
MRMKVRPVVVIGLLFVALVALRLFLNRSSEGFEGSNKQVVICKADWCGHCKKAAPEFQKLVGASPITLKDGSSATVKILDADQDKSEISKYKVRGYPTILVVNGSQTTEYPGERTSSGVINFLNSM